MNMNENQMHNLLRQADEALLRAGETDPADMAGRARRRAAGQSRRRAAVLSGVTFLMLLGASLIGYDRHQKRLAVEFKLQEDIARLKTQTQETLALIREANEEYRMQARIAELRARLESIQGRTEAVEGRTEATEDRSEALAAKLYEKAQALGQQENTESIVCDLYGQIIRSFPDTSYARPARQEFTKLNCPVPES